MIQQNCPLSLIVPSYGLVTSFLHCDLFEWCERGVDFLLWKLNYKVRKEDQEVEMVCVCVYVYVFIFFHREGFFRLQDVQDILERYGSTILGCEYLSGCFLPSSFISVSKSITFHLQRRNSSPPKNWREYEMIYWNPVKRWYIWIYDIRRPRAKPSSYEKILKIRRLL